MGNVKIILTSIRGGECYMDPQSRKDAENDAVVREFLQDREAMEHIKNTRALKDLSEQELHCAVLVGGHGALFDFPESRELGQMLSKAWYHKRGLIAAISQGVSGLINIKAESGEPLIKSKKITCPSEKEEQQFRDQLPFMLEEKLEQMGANVETKEPNEINVVVAENRLITAQNSESSKKFVEVICDYLKKHMQ